ncbi:hypothetical protein BH11MYX1_BH11MYX1_32350 [soil metagenome]
MNLVLAVIGLGLAYWSHWLIKTTGAPRSRYAVVAILTLAVLVLPWVTVIWLNRTFAAAEHLAPAAKQVTLATGIQAAMIWTLVAFGIAAIWMLAMIILTLRSSSSATR